MQLRRAPDDDAQLELFSALFTDITARDTREAMEVPFLSLSKQPRLKPIIYASNGVEVTVTGGDPWGIANIWDWDLIMWLVSQIRHGLDRGQQVSRRIRFHRHAFLKDARRFNEALATSKRLFAASGDPTHAYNAACSLARLGRSDEAVHALLEAADAGYRDLAHLDADPDLASLRDHARFSALRARVAAADRDPTAEAP